MPALNKTEPKLRPYQAEAQVALQQVRAAGRKRALIHLATGLGKTMLAATDALDYRDQFGGRILFVSHMNDINTQAKATFKMVRPKLMSARYHSGMMPTTPIVFATFQSLVRNLEAIDAKAFDYIIWDEAHHMEAITFKQVREHFQPKFELGLTATPTRADGLDILEYFGEPVYTKGLAEGIAEGWLAAVDYHIVLDDAVKKAVEAGFDAKSREDIRALFAVRVRNEEIASNVHDRRHAIGLDMAKTIVFCQNRQAAEQMAKLLGGKAYHSGVYKETRDEMMVDFREGRLPIICTVDMFNEGVDIPDARLIVFLRSTSSRTIFEQQLGRGLRRAPGKEHVTVLDFVANVERIDFVRELGKTVSKERAALGIQPECHDKNFIGPTTFQADLGDADLLRSDFVFEDSTIELLDRFNQLSQTAPKGWLSMSQLAEELHLSTGTLDTFAEQRNVELQRFIAPRGRLAQYWSPQQAQLARDHYNGLRGEPAQSLYSIAAEWDISYGLMPTLCKQAGVTPKKRLVEGGKIAYRTLLSLTLGEKEQVAKCRQLNEPGPGYRSWAGVTQLLNKEGRDRGAKTLSRELGLTPYMWGGTSWYSTEDVEKMVALYPRRKGEALDPENVIAAYREMESALKVADKFGVSTTIVYRILRSNGIDPSANKISGKVLDLPEGYMTPTQLGKEFNVKADAVILAAHRVGISRTKAYRVPGVPRPTRAYSPDQVERVRAAMAPYLEARSDVVSLVKLARQAGSAVETLKELLPQFVGVTPRPYMMYNQGMGTRMAVGVTLPEAEKAVSWFKQLDEFVALTQLMRELAGVPGNRATISRVRATLRELGIVAEQRMLRDNRKIRSAESVTIEEAERFREYTGLIIPSNYMRYAQAAEQLNVTPYSISRIVRRLGIQPVKSATGYKVAYLTPEHVGRIKAAMQR